MTDPMGQAVEYVTNAIPRMEDLWAQIKAKTTSVNAGTGAVVGGIAGALLGPAGIVAGALGGAAVGFALDKYGDQIQEAIDDFKKIVLERGSAQDLRGTAGEWNALVLHIIRDKSGALDPDKDTIGADDNWSGAARDAYLSATRGQRDNLTKLGGVVENLSTVLHDTASAHQTYWVGIAAAAATFVTSLASAVLLAELPPAAAAAAAAAVVASGALIGLLTAFENTLEEKKNSIDQGKTTLDQILGDGGTWPKAVSDVAGDPRSLSDASVADGDASDWVPVP